jgi:surface carbohydrate biosynthesis protein
MKAFLQFLQRAFKYFRNTKRVWRRPPRASLLIIDRGTASPLDEMFAHHKPHIMEIRGESVNMLALFRALPKIHLGAVAYLEAYIDFVKPKLILSRTDNNHTLWQLKRRPNVTYQVALVQNGWRTRYVRSMSVGLSLNANSRVLKSDKYFVFGNNAIDVIKERVSANFEKIGNIVLNKFSFGGVGTQDQSFDNGQRVALISTFRSKECEMNDAQQVVYESLNNFLANRGYKLLIIGNALSVFEQKLESDFFSTVFSRTNYDLGFFRNDNGSYNKLQSNKWIVSGHSTLGYESLVTGVPVGFILPSSEIFDDRDFESSSGLDRSGAFWCRSDDPHEHERVFAYLDNVSDEQWERDSGWIRDQLMVHDYGNTKIRAYVEGVLTDSLESK